MTEPDDTPDGAAKGSDCSSAFLDGLARIFGVPDPEPLDDWLAYGTGDGIALMRSAIAGVEIA